MLTKTITFCFVFVTLEEMNYFLLKKWRARNHRVFSPVITKLIIFVGWLGLLLSVIQQATLGLSI